MTYLDCTPRWWQYLESMTSWDQCRCAQIWLLPLHQTRLLLLLQSLRFVKVLIRQKTKTLAFDKMLRGLFNNRIVLLAVRFRFQIDIRWHRPKKLNLYRKNQVSIGRQILKLLEIETNCCHSPLLLFPLFHIFLYFSMCTKYKHKDL